MEKIKLAVKNWVESEKGKDILTILIIIFVGLGSFLLGRFSKDSTAPIEGKTQTARAAAPTQNGRKPAAASPTGQDFYASKQGTKYYTLGCASNIKQENKIYFKTKEEAEKAGYTLSSSCN